MNIRYFTSGLLLSAILVLFACNEDINLSAEIQGNVQFIETQYTDTFTIQTAVGIWDTVETTMSPYMLVGNTEDNYFGSLTAKAFVQLMLPDDSVAFEDTDGNPASIDSAVFSLNIDESYGDTTQPQTIQIHVVTQPIDTNIVYYQYDELTVGDKLAEFVMDENTDLTQPLRMKLSAEWIERFRQASGQTDLRTQADFERWLAGIRVSAIGGKAVHKINQFSANTYLRFYYHTENDTLTTTITTQTLFRTGYRFNQVASNLSTSNYLSGLSPQNDISTQNVNALGFVREGAGIYTKLRFPNLEKFNTQGNIYVNRAELILESADENFLMPNPILPIGLTFNLLDENGELVQNAQFVDEQYVLRELRDATVHGAYSDGRLVASYLPGGRTYQNVRMTSYIQDVINGLRPNYGFAIQSYRNDVGVSSLLFPDNQADTKNLKLRIYYTIIK